MIVLPPLPSRDDEKLDFLIEVAHNVNTNTDVNFAVRVDDQDIDVRSCFTSYSDEFGEMEFVINGVDNDAIWRSRLSVIGIASFGGGFWVELVAASKSSAVLYVRK